MKLKVYETKTNNKSNKIVNLQLVEFKDGVAVHAVDINGNYNHQELIRFKNDGTVTRSNDVDDVFGFNLDAKGRIKLKEGD